MTKLHGAILSFAAAAGLIGADARYEAAQAQSLAYCVMACTNWQTRCDRGAFAPRYNSVKACLDEAERCADRCVNKPFSMQRPSGERREAEALLPAE